MLTLQGFKFGENTKNDMIDLNITVVLLVLDSWRRVFVDWKRICVLKVGKATLALNFNEMHWRCVEEKRWVQMRPHVKNTFSHAE